MSGKVEILCPNGHWVSVKTTPNTKVLQILEEACKKQGLHPPSDYELKHGRRSLDVTLSVRYAGIPNLAKLEIIKAPVSRTESKVLIALQLPTGERVQNEFEPDISVWEVLLHFENKPDSPYTGKLIHCEEENQHPVCIYMREEVIGQYVMERTSLRSLGLTGGKAMLRLLHRSVSAEKLSSVKEKLEKEQARQDKISARATELHGQDSTRSVPSSSRTIDTVIEKPENTEQMDTETSVNAPTTSDSHSGTDANTAKHKDKKEEVIDVIYTPATRPESQQGAGVDNFTRSRIPQAAMVFIPAQTDDQANDNSVQLTTEQEAIAQSLAKAISPEMMQQRDTAERARLREERIRSRPPPQKKKQQKTIQFAEFKFPESTKGQNLYQNELSNVNKEEYKPCDREIVIYKLDEEKLEESAKSSEAMETDDVSDDFFEVNENDIKNMWSDMQKQLKEMTEAPIMTQAMKLAAKEAKMAKYERVVVRFVFPERIAVQALFMQRETVFALYRFVKEYLQDKTTDFYLYTTPPKCVLKDESCTLIEADLAPMSVVYFGSQQKQENYLSTAVKKEFSTEIEAYKVLVKYMPKSTPKEVQTSSKSGSTRSSSSRGASNSGGFPGGKVPKWFKIGRK